MPVSYKLLGIAYRLVPAVLKRRRIFPGHTMQSGKQLLQPCVDGAFIPLLRTQVQDRI